MEDEEYIDFIISDVVMLEMDGLMFVKEVMKSYFDMKMIFILGYVEDVFKKFMEWFEDILFLLKFFSLK